MLKNIVIYNYNNIQLRDTYVLLVTVCVKYFFKKKVILENEQFLKLFVSNIFVYLQQEKKYDLF